MRTCLGFVMCLTDTMMSKNKNSQALTAELFQQGMVLGMFVLFEDMAVQELEKGTKMK